MYQGKVDSKTMSKKKNRFIVIFFVLLIIICGIVFLSGSKETTSSANTNMETVNNNLSIKIDGVTVSGLDASKEHGWVEEHIIIFNGKQYKYRGYVQIKNGKLYPYNGYKDYAGSISDCEMIIMGKKGKYSGSVTCFEGKLYAHGTGIIDFDEGGYCSAAFSLGKIENADVNYYYPNGDWFSGTVINNKFVKGSLKIKKTGRMFFGTFTPKGKPLKGEWLDV